MVNLRHVSSANPWLSSKKRQSWVKKREGRKEIGRSYLSRRHHFYARGHSFLENGNQTKGGSQKRFAVLKQEKKKTLEEGRCTSRARRGASGGGGSGNRQSAARKGPKKKNRRKAPRGEKGGWGWGGGGWWWFGGFEAVRGIKEGL